MKNLLWHSDWQDWKGTAFNRWKEEIPPLVSVMEENSFPASTVVLTLGAGSIYS